ncbi:ABC transporter ATP-binding protein/permease [Neobacillus sp. MER 74]|uniref:ABC transporter ATP-binding protein n=1 Tax=Neobacillus sp. MER 74 TaxID=2939566 RepID=UPI00203D489F|nr:ABC transporter ATP-binding protein [Neobacillus sp. MER 74]MCM3115104.1 ABC transporter ATP-binding protein/permease [Neobacillus sp. MER 74]
MKHILYFTKQIHSYSGRILYFNLFGMFLISLFESVGIFLLVPLISHTKIMVFGSNDPSLISWISNIFDRLPETISLSIILGIYVLIMIGQSIFQQNQMILNAKIQQGFIRFLREQTYQHLLQANWSFFLSKRKSDIINLMSTEIARVGGGVQLFLQFLTSIIFMMIQIGFAILLSAKMTLFILAFGVALIYCSRKFIKKSNQIGKDTLLLSQTYLATITDNFNGIKDIKGNTLEETQLSWFRLLSEKIEKNIIEFVQLRTISQLVYKVVSSLLIATFVFLAVKMFQAQPAQLMLIIVIFSRLWPRFSGLQSNLEQLGSIIPSFKALVDLQNQCLDAKEMNEGDIYNVEPVIIQNELECKNVFFRYNKKQSTYALKDVSLRIPVNQMTAVVGKSGAGKSTLVDLLMGLNQPESGEVLIDGNPLRTENLLSLRRSVGYVPQDPFLFNATIRENLLIINNNASEDEIWDALEFSVAAEFVRKLPKGLDTPIGDRGVKLSGGERQRLVLARAILRKPTILVLDEATSALDTENESKIQKAIERLKGKMTIIVIAHRLSTIQNADQVIVLEQGEILQQGQFYHLANDNRGMFNHLLKNQLGISV